MPTVKRFPTCRVEIRTSDHPPPPHVHVVFPGNRNNLVEIETGTMVGPVSVREIADALEWIEKHRVLSANLLQSEVVTR